MGEKKVFHELIVHHVQKVEFKKNFLLVDGAS